MHNCPGYKFGSYALARNPRLEDNELMFVSFVLISPNGIMIMSAIQLGPNAI